MQESIAQNQEQESAKKEIFTKKMIEYQRQKSLLGKRFKLVDPSISSYDAPASRKISCLKVASHDSSALYNMHEGTQTVIDDKWIWSQNAHDADQMLWGECNYE